MLYALQGVSSITQQQGQTSYGGTYLLLTGMGYPYYRTLRQPYQISERIQVPLVTGGRAVFNGCRSWLHYQSKSKSLYQWLLQRPYMEESGSRWVEFVVDNRVVVDIINNTHSKEPHLMHLIKLLVFLACHYDFGFKAAHITVKENILADGLSKIMSLTLCRKSLKPPSNIPLLLTLLSLNLPWTSTP